MPKLMGVNLLGGLLAALAMYFVGYLWYGVLFSEIWMAARGYAESDLTGPVASWMAAGFVIELVMAFGLGWLMKRLGVRSFGAAVGFAVTLGLLIGAPLMSYEFVYGAYHHVGGWLVDLSHILAVFVAGSIVLSFFD